MASLDRCLRLCRSFLASLDYDHLFHRRFGFLQVLDAHLLDLGFPNFGRHPGRRALGLVHLHPLAFEYVQLLRAPLPHPDVRLAPVGCLQGPRDSARPGVALPRPELRTPVHQDGAPDHRPPGRRGRDPGGLLRRQELSRKKVTPHILRHSHVVNALMAGVPVPMIQIAGWYLKLWSESLLVT